MGRPKKLSPENILAGLGIDVRILGINEVTNKHGKKQIHISVENTSHTRKCPACGCTHCNIKDSGSNQWAYHVTQGKRIPCKLLFHRERYICKNCGSSFPEVINWLTPGIHMTKVLYDAILKDLCHYSTKKEIARVNGIPVHFVDAVLDSFDFPVPKALPEVVCLDETHSEVYEDRKISGLTKWYKYTTNFSDGLTGELLDILPFRTKNRMVKYFRSNFSYKERSKVKFLCSDMGKQYLTLAEKCFPNATVCLDNYHVINRLNKAVNTIRIREQNYLLSDNQNAIYTDLKKLSHKLVTSLNNQSAYWKDHSAEINNRMMFHFDRCPELKDAYAMLQYFHEIFSYIHPFDDKCKYLNLWISIFEKSTSDDIRKAVRSVKDHLPYIHNAWKNELSNATCEGNNCAIQTIKNVSFGIHRFSYFRKRMLLVVGRPGVARSIEKKLKPENGNPSNLLFFNKFPSLEEYHLAYDYMYPRIDMSDPDRRYPS